MAEYQPPYIKHETETKENIKNPDDESSREHVHVELVNVHDEENLKTTDLKTFTQTDELKIMKPPLDILDQEDVVLSYQQQTKEEMGNTEPSELICPRFNLPVINKTNEIAFQSNSIHSLTSQLSDEMDICNKPHVFVTV